MKPSIFGPAMLCIVLCLLLFATPEAKLDQSSSERLAAVGKLWIAAKYFHPYLAYQDIDWDHALITCLPRVKAARDAREYRAAVQVMLDGLHDPVTRVLPASGIQQGPAKVSETKILNVDKEANGILLVTLRQPGSEMEVYQAAPKELEALASVIADAKGIVFDLRAAASPENYPAVFSEVFDRSPVALRLSATPVRGPGQRRRMHSGLPPASGGFGGYHSAFTIDAGRIYPSASGSVDHPIVFLVNEHSQIPPVGLALQAAGKAAVFREGGMMKSLLVETVSVPLGDGLTAALRLSEQVVADGSGCCDPSLVVDGKTALEQALAQAAEPKMFPLSATKLPVIPIEKPDRAYNETSYPSVEYRLMAGFQVWGAFRYFFAYRELMGEDWDRVLIDYLPKLEEAKDAREYHLAVAGMVTHVHDSHAFVSSRELTSYFGPAAVPFRVRMIEGKPTITRLYQTEGAHETVPAIGDIVLSVDGEDAATRISRHSQYLAASTPQSLSNIVMQRFLNGPEKSMALLTVQRGDGSVGEVKVERRTENLRHMRSQREGPVTRMLPGNIGYADLDRLMPAQVDEMFDQFRNTKAIIFDMRGYPNGTAWSIAPRLSEKKDLAAALFFGPLSMAPAVPNGEMLTHSATYSFVQSIPASDKWRYTGKTVMLIDERTVSQAEHTGLFLRAANGTKFVGSATTGANGDVTNFVVPGGITIGFSGHDVRHPDGKQLQRVGLQPDVLSVPTIEGIREGRDEVLEMALQYLSTEHSP